MIAYRVLDITDGKSQACGSYCTPRAMFWLSKMAVDEPNADVTVVQIERSLRESSLDGGLYRCSFMYDGGMYIGELKKFTRANYSYNCRYTFPELAGVIRDISSL